MRLIRNIQAYIKKRPKRFGLLALLFLAWLFCLPSPLFNDPTATVVTSKEGELLGARIASDGQWRFPAQDSVPDKFKQCLLYFEDEYFYQHPGFNPVSMSKALWENLTTDRRRGGSTLTQQVIRLSRKNRKRTYCEKFLELVQATRLEAGYSKEEILNLYAAYAPFGGNVVGLETASWRYFGVPSYMLSWGQAAVLAVLPNAPALIYPGAKKEKLLAKRNRLLEKLWQEGVIDNTTYSLALQEPLPDKPKPLPELAPHFTEHIKKLNAGKRIRSTIELQKQKRAQEIVQLHHQRLKQNEINNLALLVLDIETHEVVAYVGNTPVGKEDQNFVDIIQRPRSTGSILKPFLYANMLDRGQLLPDMLVADVPTAINGYTPANFSNDFVGAIAASEALSRSLNIPAVKMLEKLGLQPFYSSLQKSGLTSIDQPADHYGLSLILGGAESSLWEVTNAYANMGRTLNFYTQSSSEYQKESFKKAAIIYNQKKEKQEKLLQTPEVYSAASIYHTFEALQNVNRPFGQENWSYFNEGQPIAWKTGTSYGFKDAWAVGVTPKYAIGVWVGNADGEGRPGLTGIQAAAPVLFDVLEALPPQDWFATPYDELSKVSICSQSGHVAGPNCNKSKDQYIINAALRLPSCPYHKKVFLNAEQNLQVTNNCSEPTKMVQKNWFSLPPFWAHYYARNNPNYKALPPFAPGCDKSDGNPMQFIFPDKDSRIVLGKDFDGQTSEVVFSIAHTQAEAQVFWYLDKTFVGMTEEFHEMALLPAVGEYLLTAVDEKGNELSRRISVQ